MRMIRSNSYIEMLLMLSCSKDNATKWPITGSCQERERSQSEYFKFSVDDNNNELILLQLKISTVFIFSYLNSHYMKVAFFAIN
jgi:hypothetical protein